MRNQLRTLATLAALALVLPALGGCIIVERTHHHHHHGATEDCAKAEHGTLSIGVGLGVAGTSKGECR